jgi:2-polyprenyl-3-methyl-5-hydroxy-6-metoxy-1,4-benzoquinol methylase
MDLHRWQQPRKSIATRFEKNDMGYATDGAIGANLIYSMFDITPSITKTLTILDYGCGTGRICRPLISLFKTVYAYDPSPECIEQFKVENLQCDRKFTNLVITTNLDDIPKCDLAFSINVIEHLSVKTATTMISNLRSKGITKIVMDYSINKNFEVMKEFLTLEEIELDKRVRIKLRLLDISPRN